MRFAAIFILLISVIAAAGQLYWLNENLPDIVPTHFDAAGVPDAWSSRSETVAVTAVIHGVLLVPMCGIALFLPAMPSSLINIPHREYWLADARKPATIRQMQSVLMLVTSASLWLLIGIMYMSSLVAHEVRDSISPELWILVGLFVAFCVGIVIYSSMYFRKPAREHG